MFALFLGNAVTFLILFGDGCGTPVVEYDRGLRYEEYVVEHEISSEQARNSTLSTDMQLVNAPPGCQVCTPEEKRYCLGADLINDHCCCDKRHNANEVIKNILSLYGNGVDIPATYDNTAGIQSLPAFASFFRRRCPLCDSSVYSYCSDKLFHDSCCCHNPNNPYDRLPYQCKFADCSFLHANSCQEHKLISACCCTSVFLHRK